MAIYANPHFEIPTFATKSPTELPQASMVAPKKAESILNTIPNNPIRSTRIPLKNSIHKMHITREIIENKTLHLGGVSGLVVK